MGKAILALDLKKNFDNVIAGHSSSPAQVMSGVPRGSVLGPPLVLIYINDIASGISSSIRLFADDCALFIGE